MKKIIVGLRSEALTMPAQKKHTNKEGYEHE